MTILDAVEAALEQSQNAAVAAAVAPVQQQLDTANAALAAAQGVDVTDQQSLTAANAQVATLTAAVASLQGQITTYPRPTLYVGATDLPVGEYHNVVFTGLVKWFGPTLIEDATWDLQPGAAFGTYANLIGAKSAAIAAAGGLVGHRWRMNGHGLSAFLNAVGGSGFTLDQIDISGTVDGIHQDLAGTSKVTNLTTHDGTLIKGTPAQTGQSDGVTHGDAVQLLVGHLDVDTASLAGYSNAGIKVAASTPTKVSGSFTNIAIADGVPVAGINISNLGNYDDLSGISFDGISFAASTHLLFETFGTVSPKIGKMVDSTGAAVLPKKIS